MEEGRDQGTPIVSRPTRVTDILHAWVTLSKSSQHTLFPDQAWLNGFRVVLVTPTTSRERQFAGRRYPGARTNYVRRNSLESFRRTLFTYCDFQISSYCTVSISRGVLLLLVSGPPPRFRSSSSFPPLFCFPHPLHHIILEGAHTHKRKHL